MRIPQHVIDLYQEFKFTEHFGLSISYEDMPAHKVDWWTRFIRMDQDVKAEIEARNK